MKRFLSYTIVLCISTIVLAGTGASIRSCLTSNSNIYLISQFIEIVNETGVVPLNNRTRVFAATEEGPFADDENKCVINISNNLLFCSIPSDRAVIYDSEIHPATISAQETPVSQANSYFSLPPFLP